MTNLVVMLLLSRAKYSEVILRGKKETINKKNDCIMIVGGQDEYK